MGIRNGNLYRVIPTNLHSVIPTFVGMTGFEIAAFIGKNRNRSAVIPAQAGI